MHLVRLAPGIRLPRTGTDAILHPHRVPRNMEIGDVPGTMPNFRSPGFSQWDFALLKNIGLGGEAKHLQLRFEAQNLFNHMNAAAPDGTVGARTFGMVNA